MAKLSKQERARVENAADTLSKAAAWMRGFAAAHPTSLLNPPYFEVGAVKVLLADLLKD